MNIAIHLVYDIKKLIKRMAELYVPARYAAFQQFLCFDK